MKSTLPLLAASLLFASCGETPTATPGTPTATPGSPTQQKALSMFRQIEDTMLASPQISVADVAAAKAQGVTLIVNNRPDGEDPSTPQGADIEAAAKAAGIDYVAIPVTHAGFSRPQIDALNEALDKVKAAGGKALGYCRSGTRSTLLWSLAQASKGESPRVIAAKAADAGYDVAPVEWMLETLSGAAKQP